MNICVVGCGGIGSYFAEHIDRLIELEQLNYDDCKFTFFDDDKVEKKNMLYQNFGPEDIDSPKIEALRMRYFNINFKNKRVDFNDINSKFDLIILCADNNKIRREAYKLWKENDTPFIDSRANGKAIGIFSSDTDNYLNTIDDSDESFSCQNPFQIEKKQIEYGNVVIAAVLAQTMLGYYRTKNLPNDFMVNF